MNPNSNPRSQARSAARLAAVQALYQQQMEGTALNRLLDEFHQHRLGRAAADPGPGVEQDVQPLVSADEAEEQEDGDIRQKAFLFAKRSN